MEGNAMFFEGSVTHRELWDAINKKPHSLTIVSWGLEYEILEIAEDGLHALHVYGCPLHYAAENMGVDLLENGNTVKDLQKGLLRWVDSMRLLIMDELLGKPDKNGERAEKIGAFLLRWASQISNAEDRRFGPRSLAA